MRDTVQAYIAQTRATAVSVTEEPVVHPSVLSLSLERRTTIDATKKNKQLACDDGMPFPGLDDVGGLRLYVDESIRKESW